MSTASFTFEAATHCYRNEHGIVVPSVTQCLNATGLISFAHVAPDILRRKQQLGTLVHRVTELYDKGEDLASYEIPDSVWEYVNGYLTFRNDTGFTPTIIEAQSLGEVHGMFFGMQPDRVGPIHGQDHILELKCGSQVSPAWAIQLAGYGTGLYGPRPTLPRVALQLGSQFPRGYHLHPFDIPSDYQTWFCSLALTSWQNNNKLFELEGIPERLEAA